MSMAPAALQAYARAYLRDRQREARHAALVAQARQAHLSPPARLSLSVPATVAHLAVLLSPLTIALVRLARK